MPDFIMHREGMLAVGTSKAMVPGKGGFCFT